MNNYGLLRKLLIAVLLLGAFAVGFYMGHTDLVESTDFAESAHTQSTEAQTVSYGFSFIAHSDNDTGNTISVPVPIVEDYELQNVFYSSMRSSLEWLTPYFTEVAGYAPHITCISENLFSLHLAFAYTGNGTNCNTVNILFDMATGEVLYLDDIVEVEELAKLILISGTAHLTDRFAEQYEVYPQEVLDSRYSLEKVNDKLALCSVPYSEEKYNRKPSFYLETGKLYLLNVLDTGYWEDAYFHINLDDIEHLLKVDRW